MMSVRAATMVTRRCIKFLPFKCSTERLHQGLSRQKQAETKSENSNIEIRNKTQPNKSKPEQFQNEESESRLFGRLCFLGHLKLFRISSFEFVILIFIQQAAQKDLRGEARMDRDRVNVTVNPRARTRQHEHEFKRGD